MSPRGAVGEAAGPTSGPLVADPRLAEGYRLCGEITREHGTTYYWGARLLPKDRRRHVFSVYALCRLADDIVDAPGATEPGQVALTESRLGDFADAFRSAVAGEPAQTPVLAAAAYTARSRHIDPECFDRFFAAMAQDLTTTTYQTWEDLLGYMEGSAAVIGEMMLPVLEPRSPEALQPARSLGLAFQLTNFLRDIGEDLGRGRVYVPQEDLRRFGADPWARTVTPQWRQLMAYEIARNRALYADADRGIALLPATSARCVSAARQLYSRILDRIEAADYDVFAARVRVPTWHKAATSARVLALGPPNGR